MLIVEFVIPMPLTCSEYERGLLYSVLEASKRESQRGTGVEILANEPFIGTPFLDKRLKNGQYTKKVYYIGKTVPKYVAKLAPKSSMVIYEESWNSFPYCRTILTNKKMGKDFYIQVDSLHVDKDKGNLENAHQLDEESLKQREVVFIDIAREKLPSSSESPDEEPETCKSIKTGRGPLAADWISSSKTIMTCYKLYTVYFKWFGLQKKMERFIVNMQYKLCLKLHKNMFCTLDQWIRLSIADIRRMEELTRLELERILSEKKMRGKGNQPGPSGLVRGKSSYISENSTSLMCKLKRKRFPLDCTLTLTGGCSTENQQNTPIDAREKDNAENT